MGKAVFLGVEISRPAETGKTRYPNRAKFAMLIPGDDRYEGADVQTVEIDDAQLAALKVGGSPIFALFDVDMFTRVQQFGDKTVARTKLTGIRRLASVGAYDSSLVVSELKK